MNKSQIVLIDGFGFIFASYYALPKLSSPTGIPTGATKGFNNLLNFLSKKFDKAQLVVVFDSLTKTFRKEQYSEYKANRDAMPEDLAVQIPSIKRLVELYGIPSIEKPGFEADDLIATLALQGKEQGKQVIVASNDKDLLQLVSEDENILVYQTNKNKFIKNQDVIDKYGVNSKQFRDYLALVGDKSDNVPGVAGIGAKKASKLLQKYGNITEILNNVGVLASREKQAIQGGINDLQLSKDLVSLCYKVEVELVNLKNKPINESQLAEFLVELGFKSDLNKGKIKTNNVESLEFKRKLVLTEEDLAIMLADLANCQEFAFDTETDSLEYLTANIVGISFACRDNSYYVPLNHNYDGIPNLINQQLVGDKLADIFYSKKLKIAQNLKFDLHIIVNNFGYDVNKIENYVDTMLMSYVLNSIEKNSLDMMASKLLNYQTQSYEEVVGKGKKQINFAQVTLDIAKNYACEDAEVTLKVYQQLSHKIEKNSKLKSLLFELELPLLKILFGMEKHGSLISSKVLNEQTNELAKKLIELEDAVHKIAGYKININSPKQLQKLLYEDLNIEPLKKGKTGYSTAVDVLQKLANKHEIAKLILDYRHLYKIKTTYTEKLSTLLDDNSRLHTTFNQAIALTGRLSSVKPNLQNIPIKDDISSAVRKAFIAQDTYSILSVDYSQIELRLMAHFSEDKNLLKAFQNNEDVHTFTASVIFDLSLDNITKEQRRIAKIINFGLIYGMSAFGLANQLNITNSQAKKFIDLFFTKFSGVKRYMTKIADDAEKIGYVETIMGRRIYLSDIRSNNKMLQQRARRLAINGPLQGSAADIIKKSMLDVHNWLVNKQLINNCFLLSQVHDELIFEVKTGKLAFFKTKISEIMQNSTKISVPLLVNAGGGLSWYDAH